MREFNLSDVFKMSRIMEQANMAETIKSIYAKSKEIKNASLSELSDTEDSKKLSEIKDRLMKEAGGDLISFIVSAMADKEIEKQIYDLIAGIAEKKAIEIEKLPLKQLKDLLKEISEKNDLNDFFSHAVKLL